MANFKGHLAAGASLGAAYGFWGAGHLDMGWGGAVLGAGLTTLGGLLPDLDSDSGVPVRELFNLSGALAPVLLLPRLNASQLTTDQIIVVVAGVYLLVRFGAARAFRHLTVHRGMFHSLPGMLIAGLGVFLLYHNADAGRRAYMAGGMMLGFLSHLVLDELFAVDFMGLTPRLNKYAGSALKLWSRSWSATVITYAILLVLALPAWRIWVER
jgi:membrane-bound metal-dependent hydrolase YbcI (DUF457 family)